MRNKLLATAAIMAMATAIPAFAQTPQTTPQTAPQPAPMQHTAVVPGHEPKSMQASNIGPADTHSDIAPALPAPSVGPDATADQLLQAAKMSLDEHHSGAAQEALERAETRLLDRSTAPSAAGSPDQRPRVQAISQALSAIGRHDWPAAHAAIDSAMKHGSES